MEEFKTAHSKMFNKLRQAANKTEQQQRPNCDNENNSRHADDGAEAGDTDKTDGNSPAAAINKAALKSNATNIVIKARTSVAG